MAFNNARLLKHDLLCLFTGIFFELSWEKGWVITKGLFDGKDLSSP